MGKVAREIIDIEDKQDIIWDIEEVSSAWRGDDWDGERSIKIGEAAIEALNKGDCIAAKKHIEEGVALELAYHTAPEHYDSWYRPFYRLKEYIERDRAWMRRAPDKARDRGEKI